MSTAVPDTPEQIIERLPPYFTISMIAKRNQGKTYYITQLIKALKKAKRVDRVVILSGTAGLNDDYKDVVSPELIMPFSESVLENIWSVQSELEQKERDHILIVLDDCLSDVDAQHSDMINKLYAQSRHLQISLAVLSQYGGFLLTPLRLANSDMILWCKLNVRGLEKLWLCTSGIDKKAFYSLSQTFSNGNYQYMVLDNYIRSANVSDQLTFTKAI
jgi:hypothetical protein